LLIQLLTVPISVSAAEKPARRLQGEVTVRIRGLGAAPLGIASAVFGSTAMAYNLGRFQAARGAAEPVTPSGFPGEESHFGDLAFELEQQGRHSWRAVSFSLHYQFIDRTSFSEDKVTIHDSLNADGDSRWSHGRWPQPAGWRPGVPPPDQAHHI